MPAFASQKQSTARFAAVSWGFHAGANCMALTMGDSGYQRWGQAWLGLLQSCHLHSPDGTEAWPCLLSLIANEFQKPALRVVGPLQSSFLELYGWSNPQRASLLYDLDHCPAATSHAWGYRVYRHMYSRVSSSSYQPQARTLSGASDFAGLPSGPSIALRDC